MDGFLQLYSEIISDNFRTGLQEHSCVHDWAKPHFQKTAKLPQAK